MPLSVNFSTAQVSGEPSEIVFTDTSTGTDATVAKRRIYMQKSDGTYLVEEGTTTEYEEFNDFPATTSITLDVLEQDEALTITVQWLTSGNSVVYDKTLVRAFTMYNSQFSYGLTQLCRANALLINDNNFWGNKSLLREYIDSGDEAIEQASDTDLAQICYDFGTSLRNDSQYAFNGNS
jgi:hypothetical protein